MQNQVSDKNSSKKPDNSWIAEFARTIILSILLALGIRTFVAEARWIPSGSMEPTLHGTPNQWEADKIIVDKVTYRFSLPQRGDIVVFSPTQELQNEKYEDAFIKRVIALPGERVEIKDGKIYINGRQLPENNYLEAGQRTSVDVCTSGPQPPLLHQPVTVPPDSYLVLGDNRSQSYDGRCWGFVPRQNIIGRAIVRFWPLPRIGGLDRSYPLYPENSQ